MSSVKTLGFAEAENNGIKCATILRAQGHEMIADEIEELGGKNVGPSPMDYLCMSLASCKAITLHMYVLRKQWDVEVINVKVNFVQDRNCSPAKNTFYCDIAISGNIDEPQQHRLQEIAKICPVSRVLINQNEVVTKVTKL